MEARPLADQFGDRPRIGELVGGGTRPMVGRDIADAVAGGLDGMHLDLGQASSRMSARVLELDPVELDVLARGEMAIAAVPPLGDLGELVAAGAMTACHRGWRSAAYRRGAADRGRSSAARAGTRPRVSSPARRRLAWSRNCAVRSCDESDDRIRHSDTWLTLRTAGNAPPSAFGLLAEIERGPWAEGADALADMECADLPVFALGIEEIGAGHQIGALILLAARFERAWRAWVRAAATASRSSRSIRRSG